MAERIFTKDSAVIETSLISDQEEPIVADAVDWELIKPDGKALIVSTLPTTPATGDIYVISQAQLTFNAWDTVQWDGATWQQVPGSSSSLAVGTSDAKLIIPGAAITQEGLYRGRARFTLPDGTIQSELVSFEAYDPLEFNVDLNDTTASIKNRIVDHAWIKLEDLFDSELGGPWLQDKTLKTFNRDKLARFLPDALYLINNEFQPTTTFDETNWPEGHIPLASQALMLEGIYHLVRSYVEQPLPTGGEISYFDRRDYMARWQSVLQSEEAKLLKLIDVFKLQYTGFGSTAILVGGYATPITRMSKFWRTRYPRYIGPWGF